MKKLVLLFLLGLLVGLIGCGGDDNGGGQQPAPELSAPAGETIQVSETDFKLDPANPRISRPGRISFEVTNDGETEHSLEVEGPGGESQLPENLQPGDSATLEVNLNRAGKFEWYCPVGNHRDLGMEGEITVGSASRGGTTTDRTDTTETQTGTTETTPTQTTPTTPTTETPQEDSGGSGGGSGGGGSGGGGSGGSGSGGSGTGGAGGY